MVKQSKNTDLATTRSNKNSFYIFICYTQLYTCQPHQGSNAVETFARLKRGVEAIGGLILRKTGKKFQFCERNGFIHSCPTNLGTGMRASVHVDLPGWKVEHLKKRAKELGLQV